MTSSATGTAQLVNRLALEQASRLAVDGGSALASTANIVKPDSFTL